MAYEKSFTDTLGGTQTIRTIGGAVLIEGSFGVAGGGVSCTFNAADFRSASIRADFGQVIIQVGNDSTECFFGANRDVAFTLEDILEAVAAAKAAG